jgi:hypothetical protein
MYGLEIEKDDIDLSYINELRNLCTPTNEILNQIDIDSFSNYTNDLLYELDKGVRRYFHQTQSIRATKQLRTAVPIVYIFLFNRKPNANDSQLCKTLHKLLKYYACKVTGRNKIGDIQYTHIYIFSKRWVCKRKPYSLKLRLELKQKNFKGQWVDNNGRSY